MTLAEEKEKLDYDHKLEVRRIWLNKILIGLLIAIAGLFGNIIMEGYKGDLTKTQFLLEKRLEALADLRVSFSNLGHHAFLETFDDPSAQPVIYAQEVRSTMHIINRWGFLFSENFNKRMNHYAWIHQAAAGEQLKLTPEHWGFILAISDAFDSDTRRAVNIEVLGTPPEENNPYFKMVIWKQDAVLAKGTRQLFIDNFQKWQVENRSD